MQITEVRVRLRNDEKNPSVKAHCSVTIDGVFVIHNVLIILPHNGNMFVQFPQEKDMDNKKGHKWRDICHPLDTETRKYISDAILDAYAKEVTKHEYDKSNVSGECSGENNNQNEEGSEV